MCNQTNKLSIVFCILGLVQIIGCDTNPCYVPEIILCSPQKYCRDKEFVIVPTNAKYSCQEPFILNGGVIQFEGGNFSGGLNVTADNVSMESVTVIGHVNIAVSELLQINRNLNISGNFSAEVENGSEISSTIYIHKAQIQANNILLFSDFLQIVDSKIVTTTNQCLYDLMDTREISAALLNASNEEIKDLKTKFPFSMLLKSSTILLERSYISTTIIILDAYEGLNLTGSVVNTSARACRANTGLGHGMSCQVKDQSFCTAGASSTGYGTHLDPKCASIFQYLMFLTHSFPYMGKGPYVSTGSGGYGYTSNGQEVGAGGGVVFIFVEDTLSIDSSSLLADGGSIIGNYNLSAGSAGCIYIHCRSLNNNRSNFSAAGGASYNAKGSGAGGMVKVSFLDLFEDDDQNSRTSVNISSGYLEGSSTGMIQSGGVFFGVSCPPGQFPYYLKCQPCPQSTFNVFGTQICQPCPQLSHYSLNNTTGKADLNSCFEISKPSQFQEWVTPGQISGANILWYIVTLVTCVILGLLLKKKLKKKLSIMQTSSFSVEDASKDTKSTNLLTDKLKQEKNIKFEDLMYHIHRITLVGTNSPQCPWVLPDSPPEQLKKFILLQGFSDFAYQLNRIAKWTTLEKVLCHVLLAVYPLYWFYYDRCKKSKYKKILQLFEQSKQFNLINNYDCEDKDMVTIKVSKNTDYTIFYVDFMFYEAADPRYFNLTSPFIITLSGEGSFLRPFYLEDRDVFFNSLFYILNRSQQRQSENDNMTENDEKLNFYTNLISQKRRQENTSKLISFLKQFNRMTICLDLSSPLKVLISNLQQLIGFLSKQNKQYFNGLRVQLDLILMISKLKKETITFHEIHILTNQDTEKFQQFISTTAPMINKGGKVDLKFGLFVYNPLQELRNVQRKSTFSIPKFWQKSIITGLFQQDSIKQPMLEEQQAQEDTLQTLNTISKLRRLCHLLRYWLFCHRKFEFDQDIMKFMLTAVILNQVLLVFIWSFKLQLPYVFVNLVAPFVGILWVVSDSYGIGKIYLILNALCICNGGISIVVSAIENIRGAEEVKIMISQLVDIIISILAIGFGTRFLTVSWKLSGSKMFK